MSNLVPLRRTTRATRTTTKDNENANARPSRISTRAKVHVAGATVVPTATTDAPTLPSKLPLGVSVANQIVKRKRDVLVEVTGVSNNNRKTKDAATGKGKEKDSTDEKTASKPTVVTKSNRESIRRVEAAGVQKSSKSTTVVTRAIAAAQLNVEAGAQNDEKISRFSRPDVRTGLTHKALTDDAEVERVFKKRHTEPPVQNGPDESQLDAERIAADLAEIDPEDAAQIEEEKPQAWDDLDANDWDDPVMVSEYVAEVCVYLKEIEASTCPNPDYMSKHTEIDWEKRGILVDWVLQVHARFNLLQETLFLFTNILDRFLSSRPISLSKFQLVGITAFFIAAKYEETYSPSVAEIARLADDMYSIEDILKAERYILKTLDWDLRYPGPLGWLRRGSKADDCEIKARTVGKYLIEIGCLEWRLVGTAPSVLAAAAMWLARLVLGREVWTPNLEHYMTYSEAELLPTANILVNYILEPIQHQSLYKKYAHKKYLKCSAFMRRWALERWAESTTVDLAADLPSLKEDIRLEREARKHAQGAGEET